MSRKNIKSSGLKPKENQEVGPFCRRVSTGAASFYIVMFSTLLLTIIVVSFATIVLSQMARTSNDDLSNSAYDAALAGVEDAKTAILDYEYCLNNPSGVGSSGLRCGKIIQIMTGTNDTNYTGNNKNCDKVGRILQRYGSSDGNGEVVIKETKTNDSSSDNSMNEAYTCVTVDWNLDDYSATLGKTSSARLLKVKLAGSASDVKSVKVRWYSTANAANKELNIGSDTALVSGTSLRFRPVSSLQAPPVLSFTLIQTGTGTNPNGTPITFSQSSVNDFTKVGYSQTDLASIYLVPATNSVSNSTDNSYILAGNNLISAVNFAKTADKTSTNLPYVVKCSSGQYDGYACEATIALPGPVESSERNDDTFLIMVSLPYHSPETDFSLSFYATSDGTGDPIASRMQYAVDSTGRASDLYRRVSTRLETTNSEYPFPAAELQLTGDDGGSSNLTKTIHSIYESHFGW